MDENMRAAIESYRAQLAESGLSDCPYNITAFKTAWWAAELMTGHSDMEYIIRVLWSDQFEMWLTYICVVIDKDSGECAPMLMVMTSEYISRASKMGAALCCGGPNCNHETCGIIPDDLRGVPRSGLVEADPEYIVDRFSPIVESVEDGMPRFEDLAKFYDVPEDKEGG